MFDGILKIPLLFCQENILKDSRDVFRTQSPLLETANNNKQLNNAKFS